MAFVDIPAGEWTEIVTTAANTVIQNRGPVALYLLTSSTAGIDLDAGLEVPPGAAVEVTDGITVSGASINVDGRAFYMEV